MRSPPGLLLVAATLLAEGAALAEQPAPPPALGIVVDDSLPAGGAVARALVGAAAESGRFLVVPPLTTAQHLEEAESLGIVCAPDNVECLARAASASSLPFLLVARGGGGDSPTLRLVLVDASRALVEKQVEVHIAAGEADAALGARAAVSALLDGAPLEGTLVLDDVPANAAVVVDGLARGDGSAPLALAPGPHDVVLRVGQREAARGRVDILAGVTTRAALLPVDEAAPSAGDGHPLLWVGGGLFGAGLVSAAALGAAGLLVLPSREARRKFASAAAYNQMVLAGQVLLVGAGLGGLVTAVGGGILAASLVE